jgi:enoyl-CoA hydratase
MTDIEPSTPTLTIDGRVAAITLMRPAQANRLTPEDLSALAEHIDSVNARPEVLVLQLRATGKYFCSGFDINRIGKVRNVPFDSVVNAFEDARPVTLAVIHGGVYGGGTDLAIACDFRLGVTHGDMFMPAARLGLHFSQRGLERFSSRIGVDATKRLFLTAQRIDATEMHRIGYLTHLYAAAELEQAVTELTTTLASMAPLPLLGMKKHLNRMARGVLDVEDLRADVARAAASEDLKEGQAAWAEKRPPKFTGR